MERFLIEIDIGNDAMQGAPDIVDALREVIGRIEMGHTLFGKVSDANGNKCGKFHIATEVD